jgi:predicted nucleic acid-binding protein
MTVFFDTSSLFKLYHREEGSDALMAFFNDNPITTVLLAEIAEIEFGSVVWKKCRLGEITVEMADTLLAKFQVDCARYTFVRQDAVLRDIANAMMRKHWKAGLRTLDAIQLASVLTARPERFLCSDRILSAVASQEGIAVL